jgi:hypothetical protein
LTSARTRRHVSAMSTEVPEIVMDAEKAKALALAYGQGSGIDQR